MVGVASLKGGVQPAESEGLWVTLVGALARFWTSWSGALGRAELAIRSSRQPLLFDNQAAGPREEDGEARRGSALTAGTRRSSEGGSGEAGRDRGWRGFMTGGAGAQRGWGAVALNHKTPASIPPSVEDWG